jgi:quercetin dioxygenase-like cupin family protein
LVQAVVEYAPGSFSAIESVPYDRYFTVMEGELTFTTGEKTNVYAAGKNFSVPSGILAKGSNEGRSLAGRVFVSGLVPAWANAGDVTRTPESRPSAVAPRTVHSVRLAVREIPGVINIVQTGSRYSPGYLTPAHTMNHPNGMVHLEGTTAYEYMDGGRESYTPGQGGQMYPHRPGAMANRTTTPAAFLLTYLQTPGTALTSPATAPASAAPATGPITPPRTGDAGLMAATDSRERFAGLLLLAIVTTAVALATKRSFSRSGAR